MPRYFFHTLHGRPIGDREGESLAGTVAARRAAVRIVGEILRDGGTDFWDDGDFSLVCVDEAGDVVTGISAQRISDEDAVRALRDMLPSAPV